MGQAAKNTSNYRMKALAAASLAMAVAKAMANPGPTVSASIGSSENQNSTRIQTDINSNYASVKEQSAIKAGDGGFQVDVKGKTDLKGGAITSTQKAIDTQTNTFTSAGGTTLSDLNNQAEFKAEGYQVSVAVGSSAGGSAGVGKDSGNASSVTLAAISGVAGNKDARTGDKESGIAKIFDAAKVSKEVNAQVAITSEFGKQASKAVGDYAQTKLKEAEKNKDQAGMDAWKEGGSSRVALHTLVGGLTGGVQGAVGAGAASAAAPSLDQLQGQLQQGLQKAGVGEEASKLIASVSSGAAAAGIGAAASGGSVAGGATAFNSDMNNRQLHPREVQKAKELAAKSKGMYKQEQIEEQMRLMGNDQFKEAPDTLAVLVGGQTIRDSVNADPSMPKVIQGGVAIEIPGQANTDLQKFIQANTKDEWIPDSSPYTSSNAGLNKPTTTNTPSSASITTACANNDLACRSGVGAQQSTIPQMTQDAREALADGASTLSRQAGVVAAAATAATAAASPQVKPITGSVAVGATVIGVAADVVGQVVRPDAKQVFKEQLLLGVPAEVLIQRYPQLAPLINEVKEALK